jgi:hypothetical protein
MCFSVRKEREAIKKEYSKQADTDALLLSGMAD